VRHRLRPLPHRSGRFRDQVPPIDVAYVDDPFEPVRLVWARGHVGPTSIERLFETFADLNPPHHLHLDVRDARIDDPATMDRLGEALDRLERLRIEVRIVGIDPQHPALRA
jgi:hypothetical protein